MEVEEPEPAEPRREPQMNPDDNRAWREKCFTIFQQEQVVNTRPALGMSKVK